MTSPRVYQLRVYQPFSLPLKFYIYYMQIHTLRTLCPLAGVPLVEFSLQSRLVCRGCGVHAVLGRPLVRVVVVDLNIVDTIKLNGSLIKVAGLIFDVKRIGARDRAQADVVVLRCLSVVAARIAVVERPAVSVCVQVTCNRKHSLGNVL